MELDKRGVELLFQVLTEWEERNSVAIASNEIFEWTKIFTDPRLCAAIVEPLTFGGNIIETGTDSFRLAQTRAQAESATTSRPGTTMETILGIVASLVGVFGSGGVAVQPVPGTVLADARDFFIRRRSRQCSDSSPNVAEAETITAHVAQLLRSSTLPAAA